MGRLDSRVARTHPAAAARPGLRGARPVADGGRPLRVAHRPRGLRRCRCRLSRLARARSARSRSSEASLRAGDDPVGGSVNDEHPNAALTRRVFAAFGKDAKVISAAMARDIVWRVPGQTVMSGEYHGRREVVEFLQRTGPETGGTYHSKLQTVFA